MQSNLVTEKKILVCLGVGEGRRIIKAMGKLGFTDANTLELVKFHTTCSLLQKMFNQLL